MALSSSHQRPRPHNRKGLDAPSAVVRGGLSRGIMTPSVGMWPGVAPLAPAKHLIVHTLEAQQFSPSRLPRWICQSDREGQRQPQARRYLHEDQPVVAAIEEPLAVR